MSTQGIHSAADVLHLLADIERRSLEHALSVPQQEVSAGHWEGIVFSVSGVRLVSALSEVSEILNLPTAVTRVPGTRNWVRGLANVRGTLLPIIDLQVFLGGNPVVTGRRSRVLVIRQAGITAGLLVGGVAGLRHFKEEHWVPDARMGGGMGEFIAGIFDLKGEIWPVFSMLALAEHAEFRIAAQRA